MFLQHVSFQTCRDVERICAVSTHMGTTWLLQWPFCSICINTSFVSPLIFVAYFKIGGWEPASSFFTPGLLLFWISCGGHEDPKSKTEEAWAQAMLVAEVSTAQGLQDVLRTNMGPKGITKMLVLVLETSLLKTAVCCFMKCKCSIQQPPWQPKWQQPRMT